MLAQHANSRVLNLDGVDERSNRVAELEQERLPLLGFSLGCHVAVGAGEPDGAVAWLEERATAKRDPHTGVVRTSEIVWDITERKLAEEALRESEERYRLAAEATGLGHWELIAERSSGWVASRPAGLRSG